ncbi:MAG: biliverdin-producing heme oxygenase [Planctomycetota bacterium]|nr:biliverdin-producing heme oxygenase [Planctomycetota bacterium]
MASFETRLGKPQWTQYLRELIHPWHRKAEETGFARSMIEGSLSHEDYVQNLLNLKAIHELVEAQVDRWPAFGQIFKVTMRRVKHLETDIAVLGGETLTASTEAQNFLNDCQSLIDENLMSILGLLYVLEGSRMGSMFLLPCIMNALELELCEGVGLDYHFIGASNTPARFRQFKNDLNESVASIEDRVAIGVAACAMMSGLSQIYQAAKPNHSNVQQDICLSA